MATILDAEVIRKREYGLGRKHGRSMFEIIYDILSICRKPSSPFFVQRVANLSNDRFVEIRDTLILMRLLEQIDMRLTIRKQYMTTEKGLRFLQTFSESVSYLGVNLS